MEQFTCPSSSISRISPRSRTQQGRASSSSTASFRSRCPASRALARASARSCCSRSSCCPSELLHKGLAESFSEGARRCRALPTSEAASTGMGRSVAESSRIQRGGLVPSLHVIRTSQPDPPPSPPPPPRCSDTTSAPTHVPLPAPDPAAAVIAHCSSQPSSYRGLPRRARPRPPSGVPPDFRFDAILRRSSAVLHSTGMCQAGGRAEDRDGRPIGRQTQLLGEAGDSRAASCGGERHSGFAKNKRRFMERRLRRRPREKKYN